MGELLRDLLGDNQAPGPRLRPSNFLIKYSVSHKEEKDAIDGMIWHIADTTSHQSDEWAEKEENNANYN